MPWGDKVSFGYQDAWVRAMGTTQLRSGAKDTCQGCPQAQAVLGQDSLLTSPQPLSHLLSC